MNKITGFEIYSKHKVEWNTRGGVEIYKWGISSHFPSEIVCLLLQYKCVLLIHYSTILRLRVLTLLQLIFKLYLRKLCIDCHIKCKDFIMLIWLKGTQTLYQQFVILVLFSYRLKSNIQWYELNRAMLSWIWIGWW